MADTIRDYLVSLGFDIDGAGQAKFEATLKGVAANVVKLGAIVESTGLAIVGFTASIASGLDKLYWAAERTGASVNGIKALGYAASQTGSSAEAAQNSLESLARFMRSNPGAEGFLNRLGVQTRDASGQMRDMSAIFTGVGQRLSSMPYYRANQFAQMLGIDENTLMAMRRGMSGFTAEYQSMMQKTGFDADRAAQQSNKFMTSMRNFVSLLGILRDKVGSNLAGGLSGTLNNLSKQMLENWPKIEGVVTKIVKGVLFAADVITQMAWRVSQAVGGLIEWFKKLPPDIQQLIMLVSGLVSAWQLLNAEFLKSPIGIVIALGSALFALYDDYKTWKEGGQSLLPWDKWEPEIEAALKSLGELRDSVKAIGVEIAKLLNINLKNWTLKGDIDNLTKQFGEFGKMIKMIGDLINAINEGRWKDAYAIGKNLLAQGQGQDALPAVSDSANNTADWIEGKTGFDPRSIGKTINGWIFGKEEGGSDQQESGPGKTLADRNNNPGNLRPVGGTGFTSHQTPLDGWMAMARQIRLYFTGKSAAAGYEKLQSIWDIIHKYAPASDNNDPEAYSNFVANMMGVGAKDTLNLSDPQQFSNLLQAMSRKEGYGQWNSPLASVAATQAAAQISQETNINIYGASDPASTGREVADRQSGVNSRLTQQLQPRVY
ncbi:TPA: hypothetical protein OZU43_003403 [Escherichia coli]|uniref:hypothetical protein n=1 Tax=Enterobacteriaceae TaxID=543 RepID=UPI0006A62F22|nr:MULTISPECIES: hypothetical protein [Enterobacteriaceae]EFH7034030.1 hypothetical protein [Escherichia coli]EFO3643270.1 hypothetical protein [Escherichia coli]EFT2703452.1 hypothetical protein [Escherichia coli]EGO7497940.1 hypothetical protein [Escherichia coli]EHO2939733.1 hypothetical protein [Escherichia coli]